MNKGQMTIPPHRLNAFCAKWRVTELSLFGSVLREDFRPDSDIDVLISFDPGASWTLFDLVQMRDELQEIFGREVDLVSRRGLEASRNGGRRTAILESAEVIYAS